jgi:hypothetical protein
MENNRRIEPGSVARAAESEPRPTFQRIEGGSAAKAAEQSARNAGDNFEGTAFRGSIGLNLRVSTGRKFTLPDRAQGPGEALPALQAEEKSAGEQVAGPGKTSSSDAPVQSTTGKIPGIFRRLFRR